MPEQNQSPTEAQKPEAPAAETSETANGLLTKEALTSGTRFKREEDTLEVPELGGKLRLRGVSLKEARAIRSQLPDDFRSFKISHTAFSLSKYVVSPRLTQEEWTAVLSRDDFPDKANTRIQQKIAELMAITDEEETAVADEFPGADD